MAKSKGQTKEATQHIKELSAVYQRSRTHDSQRANRYLLMIRRLAMKFRLRLPREVKHSYCKHCKQAFLPGKNCRMRTRDAKVVFYCYLCKNYTRLPLKHAKDKTKTKAET